jgi:hypothetical protein
MDVPDVDVEKSSGLLLFEVSAVIKTFDAVLAFVDVVAFPVRAPTNIDAVNVPLDGRYVNGVVVVSINNAFEVVLVVLLKGI